MELTPKEQKKLKGLEKATATLWGQILFYLTAALSFLSLGITLYFFLTNQEALFQKVFPYSALLLMVLVYIRDARFLVCVIKKLQHKDGVGECVGWFDTVSRWIGILILLGLLVLLLWGGPRMPPEEALYKDTVKTLSRLPHGGTGGLKEERVAVIENLTRVVQMNPKGRWADDALFCVVMTYFSKEEYSPELRQRKIQVLETLLADYPVVELEPWTKENFGKDFWNDFYAKLLEKLFSPSRPEGERIRGMLRLALARTLEEEGRYREAAVEYTFLLDNFPGEPITKMARENLQKLEKKVAR